MAERDRIDLQREADEARTGVAKSAAAWRRLDRFKQGEIDRWGREASVNTPVGDFYTERP
jgi:hypothetical protein